MKVALIRLGRALLNCMYSLMKLLPVKKKIVYISRQSRTVPVDFRLIEKEMRKRKPEYEQVMLIKMIDPGISAKISYCFHMLKQMYHVATAEMVILDTYCIVVSFLKQREDLGVIQIWHAMGSLKKFGKSILGTGEGRDRRVAEAMHMHENYTHVLCSGEFCKPHFAEAFGVPEEKMVVMPLPRLDLLEHKAYSERVKEKILRTYPQLSDESKQVVVFAPTFRMDEEAFGETVRSLAERFSQEPYRENYTLVLKLHPLSPTRVELPGVIQDDRFSTEDMCRFADVILLDYSAVLFDIMNLDKPVAFYVPDFEEYVGKRSFYLDFKTQMPGPLLSTEEKVMAFVEEGKELFDYERMHAFRDEMVVQHAGKSYTEELCEYLISLL